MISMISALVPTQGEKVVNYPTRPVDTTTDFEGTTSIQPSQPVCLHGFTTKFVESSVLKLQLFKRRPSNIQCFLPKFSWNLRQNGSERQNKEM